MTVTVKENGDLGKSEKLVEAVERLGQRLAQVRATIGKVIFGQTQVIDETLITLLAGGHALLIGVPGLGKTRLVETLGTAFGKTCSH